MIDTPDPDDLPSDQPVTHVKNGDRRHRELDLVSGTRTAIGVLEDYQRRLDRVVTGRLHAYLPATTLGLEVDLRQTIPGDGRYTGLRGLRPGSTELVSMRDGIRDLVADTLGRILSDASVDEVYAAWRARAAPLVDQARVRHLSPAPPCAEVEHGRHVDSCASRSSESGGQRRPGPAPGRGVDLAAGSDRRRRPGASRAAARPRPARGVGIRRRAPRSQVSRWTSLDLRGNPVGARLWTRLRPTSGAGRRTDWLLSRPPSCAA